MDEIINYVMDTPGNTNPNVLRSMLNNISGGGNNTIVLEIITNGNDLKTFSPVFTWQEAFDALDAGKQVIGIEKVRVENVEIHNTLRTWHYNKVYSLIATRYDLEFDMKAGISLEGWSTAWLYTNDMGEIKTITFIGESANSPLIEQEEVSSI